MPGESSLILDEAKALFARLADLPMGERVAVLNELRVALHEVSPFKDEPVDCVIWVEAARVIGNEYNPNTVAAPEMRLLEHSIREDGFTQPVVGFEGGGQYEVVDGFHRQRVGKEVVDIRERLQGFLPVVAIGQGRTAKSDRMASTIRHNRARGKHGVGALCDIVVELSRRGWSEERIAKELGMGSDEVLRLKQVTGLSDLFKDKSFSRSWEWSK